MKKIIAITTTAILVVCLSTLSAQAGAARRHTMEGIMLGTGIAILGAAIISEINHDSRPQAIENHDRYNTPRHNGYRSGRKNTHRKFKSHRPRGHWEVEKIWIEPVYETRWNPAHYNPRGTWVNGRVKKFLIKDGYYQEEKVWVRY